MFSFSQFIPESARFQVSAGNIKGAMSTLNRIAKMNNGILPEGELREPEVVCMRSEQLQVLSIR